MWFDYDFDRDGVVVLIAFAIEIAIMGSDASPPTPNRVVTRSVVSWVKNPAKALMRRKVTLKQDGCTAVCQDTVAFLEWKCQAHQGRRAHQVGSKKLRAK